MIYVIFILFKPFTEPSCLGMMGGVIQRETTPIGIGMTDKNFGLIWGHKPCQKNKINTMTTFPLICHLSANVYIVSIYFQICESVENGKISITRKFFSSSLLVLRHQAVLPNCCRWLYWQHVCVSFSVSRSGTM